MIHRTAIVDPAARLGAGVSVGPYSVIGPDVQIGEGSWVGAHVVLDGRLKIGRNNKIFHFASLGAPPQDKKYADEPTSVTINRGTAQDAGVTRVGSNNWIMAYVHFAHDCQIGSNTIFANSCQLAGHVVVGDWAIFG